MAISQLSAKGRYADLKQVFSIPVDGCGTNTKERVPAFEKRNENSQKWHPNLRLSVLSLSRDSTAPYPGVPFLRDHFVWSFWWCIGGAILGSVSH